MSTAPSPAPPAAGVAVAVAEVTRAVPGVARLHPGAFGEVATYLPGHRVPGVRVRPDGVEVHVVVERALLDRREPLPQVAERIHRAVAALTGGPVHVFIDDLAEPPRPPAGGVPLAAPIPLE
ncbi:hypothetical protein [Georgenia thermotolerans]|uniref:hypothetical protein n=1 Tax=Georgenia thermotolerans TaxID=527326 RepID=UPI001B8D5BA8|nr:hypothetical protein [Georgenia thermotolerans]